jgi:hypothetical protein
MRQMFLIVSIRFFMPQLGAIGDEISLLPPLRFDGGLGRGAEGVGLHVQIAP